MDSDESEQKKKENEIYIQRKKPSINDVMFVSIISPFLFLSLNLKTGLSEKKKRKENVI